MGCCGSVPQKHVGPDSTLPVVDPPTASGCNDQPDLSQESILYKPPGKDMFDVFPLNPAKITNEYRIGVNLGKGAFGVVRKCTHLLTGQERAIKIIMKEDLVKDPARSDLYLNEIEIMKGLTHPNLVSIYEYFQDEHYVYIVMELVRGVELLDRILKQKRLGEVETCLIMEQLINAMNYMHKQGVVHRDIKPENVLIDGKSIKLIDFGGARRFGSNKIMRKVSGTPFYIAPEVLAKSYDERCDVWSLGVLMFIMLTGEPPFPGRDDQTIFDKIRLGNVNFDHIGLKDVSENAKALLRKLLVHNYKQRVHIVDIIEHPWFQAQRQDVTPLGSDIMDNLKRFSVGSPLQKAIFFYLINNVAFDIEKDHLIVAFGQLDANHDGVLSKEEINKGLIQVGVKLPEKNLQDIMDQIGGPGAQTINYMEFLAATIDRRRLLNEARIEQCFKQFDQDKTGTISINNFRAMLGSKVDMSDDQWYSMIRVFDLNGDGVIEYSEFREILIKLASG